MRRSRLFKLAAGVLCGSLLAGGAGYGAETDRPAVLVFAAASLTNVLQDLGDAFTKQTSIPVKFSFAASSCARKWSTFARASTERVPPSRRSPSGFRRRGAPEWT